MSRTYMRTTSVVFRAHTGRPMWWLPRADFHTKRHPRVGNKPGTFTEPKVMHHLRLGWLLVAFEVVWSSRRVREDD